MNKQKPPIKQWRETLDRTRDMQYTDLFMDRRRYSSKFEQEVLRKVRDSYKESGYSND